MTRFFAAMVTLTIALPASARPVAPSAFCAVYPEADACADGVALCETCHTAPPGRNVYGVQLEQALAPGEARPLTDAVFLEALPVALADIEALDADGDGYDNLEELLAGTGPADPRSRPVVGDCPRSVAANGWDVCNYDPAYVFKKIHLDVCGHSPTRSALDAFAAESDRLAALHEALDRCLDSEWWRGEDGVVWNLANRKIAPLKSIKGGDGAGDIPLADYEDDYAYFVYVHTDDRDVREVLTGQYFVARTGGVGSPTVYTPFNPTGLDDVNRRGRSVGQLVFPPFRAGMLTHRWFLMSQIMFTALPRTAAAQAYRAYLGYDLSRLEGLYPVEGEPVDYDSRGVDQPECARCHSTLDPLTYPFSRYEGIQGGTGEFRIPFSFNRRRLESFTETDGPHIADTPQDGRLFGEPVADLVEWARVAADSEAFAKATVLDYWKLMMGESPRPEERAEYDTLWTELMTTHEYRVERMLHALIETEAYGVP